MIRGLAILVAVLWSLQGAGAQQVSVQNAPGTTNSVTAVGSPTQSATGTISNGTSLSAAINFGTARLARIVMPAAWTAASLTFQTSYDCTNYADLYDATGTEYTVSASTSREILVPYADFIGVTCMKIRSGTSGTPVSQGADRTLNLVLVP